jgi:hypothetical protein
LEHTVVEQSEGAVLRAKIALARPVLDTMSSRMWQSPEPVAAYRRYLAAMYPVTRSAIPLMKLARRSCLRRVTDPLSRPVIGFLTRHIREERGHDRWIAADLAALGGDPAQLARTLPSRAVASLIGAQYQLITAVHPVALLGCIAVLEGEPPSEELLVSDVSHAHQIFALLDRLELGPWLRAVVGYSALHTACQAAALFDELTGDAGRSSAAGLARITGGVDPAGLSEGENALLADMEHVLSTLPDVVAHSGEIAGGLFL